MSEVWPRAPCSSRCSLSRHSAGWCSLPPWLPGSLSIRRRCLPLYPPAAGRALYRGACHADGARTPRPGGEQVCAPGQGGAEAPVEVSRPGSVFKLRHAPRCVSFGSCKLGSCDSCAARRLLYCLQTAVLPCLHALHAFAALGWLTCACQAHCLHVLYQPSSLCLCCLCRSSLPGSSSVIVARSPPLPLLACVAQPGAAGAPRSSRPLWLSCGGTPSLLADAPFIHPRFKQHPNASLANVPCHSWPRACILCSHQVGVPLLSTRQNSFAPPSTNHATHTTVQPLLQKQNPVALPCCTTSLLFCIQSASAQHCSVRGSEEPLYPFQAE